MSVDEILIYMRGRSRKIVSVRKKRSISKSQVLFFVASIAFLTIVGVSLTVTYMRSRSAQPVEINQIQSGISRRIQVRQAADGTGGEFYDSATGERFIPRGVNHVTRANVVRSAPERPRGVTWSNFAVGVYDRRAADRFLNEIVSYGYNTVRVFIANDLVGNIPGPGLDKGYMDNVANFLSLAKARKVYVIPVINGFPWGATYWPTLSASESEQMSDSNAHFLNQRYIDARKQYLQDFVRALLERNAAVDHILGYALENEFSYNAKEKPFTLTRGSVRTASGTFDMSKQADRAQMMDSNMIQYTNQLTAAIKQVDPQALVTMGFHDPTADRSNRIFETYWMFVDPEKGGSSVDFVDLHIYPFYGTVSSHLANFRISNRNKPILVGEFGADKHTYGNAEKAAQKLEELQTEFCKQNFRGWLLWSWDTIDPDYYTGKEQNHKINSSLARAASESMCRTSGGTSSVVQPSDSSVSAIDTTTEHLPIGWLDRVDANGLVVGWAFDKNAESVEVHIYLDAPVDGGGKLIGAARTSVPRPDVFGVYKYGQNSGFTFQIPSAYLSDRKQHPVYVYAINKTLTGAPGHNPALQNIGLPASLK